MTKARRYRIWKRDGGLCEICGGFFELDEVEIDHRVAWWIGRDDSDENLRVLCKAVCHRRLKTPADRKVIAKIKRLIGRQDGTRRPRKKINSPGFTRTLRRKFNGEVERR